MSKQDESGAGNAAHPNRHLVSQAHHRKPYVPKPPEGEVLAELIGSIADHLKPWKGGLKRNDVLAQIDDKIKRLKNPNLSRQLSEIVGSSRKSWAKAKRLRATLKDLAEQLDPLGLTYRLEWKNQIGLWNPPRIKDLHDGFSELLSASDSRLDIGSLGAAFMARLLMERLSTKKPTIPSEGNSPYCLIASLLFEAVSGEPERDLIGACRRVHRLRSEHI